MNTSIKSDIVRALQTFELDQQHERVYADPNELIEAGFPASFLLPLIRVFESSESYRYFREGRFVVEMIGISHLTLIYAIAASLGVPSETGSGFTGRGFAMRANVEAIREILSRLQPSG